MNPKGQLYDLAKARRFLDFAIYFTPQYGDSFIESLRLKILLNLPT
jgi:la-related protein 1